MNHASAACSMQRLVDALVAARGSARARLHLLSFDALNDWYELESQLDCLQSRLEYEGASIRPNAADRVHQLTELVAKFLREQHLVEVSARLAVYDDN